MKYKISYHPCSVYKFYVCTEGVVIEYFRSLKQAKKFIEKAEKQEKLVDEYNKERL